jgi:hypothetical protein
MFGKTLKVVLSLIMIFALGPFVLFGSLPILGALASLVETGWPLLVILGAPIVAIVFLVKRHNRFVEEYDRKHGAEQQ